MKTFKSLIEFHKHFDTDEKCRAYLEQQRWRGKPVCPYCKCEKVYRLKDGRRFTCGNSKCKRVFSVTVGTMYENTKVSLTKWFYALYLVENHSKGISSVQLADFIGVKQKCAWFMLHRIREMAIDKSKEKMKTVVEIDETYIGGKNKNRHAHKKVKDSQGRSTKDKAVVFGIVERNGNVKAMRVKDTKSATLKPIIKKLVEAGAIINTDEWRSYRGLNGEYVHLVVKHREGEYVNGDVHTNTLEGFWSLFKRCIYGIYHNVSPKHLDRYCQEITYRYNARRMKQDERFADILSRCDGRLTYEELIS